MADQAMVMIELDRLQAHPHNSNVMSAGMFEKLTAHMGRSGQYPPVIVRAVEGGYQILDGHHRVAALRRLGEREARCVVWEVDDQQALVLLSTLNRLEGSDDGHKRAALVGALAERMDLQAVARELPESAGRLEKMLLVNESTPEPRAAMPMGRMPTAVHFFLLPEQRKRLEARLKAMGGSRESALMRLVDG